MGTTIISAIAVFLVIVLLLVSLLLFAKNKLSPSGTIKILVNGEKTLEVNGGAIYSVQQWNFPSICLWWWWNLYPM
jgi:Na+-transporting NADH:ubiquinone oxidoreductase subunit F